MIVDRGRGLRQLTVESLPSLATLFAWDVVVVLGFQLLHRSWMDQPTLPYALIGSALALFLGARNTGASARWWEARTLWGATVNGSRTLARQCNTLIGDTRPDLVRGIAAYAHALRAALSRVPVPDDRAAPHLTAALAARMAGATPRPTAILHAIAAEIAAACAARGIDGALHAAMDRTLSELTTAHGGLERLRNTPLAVQFSVLPRLFVRLFCLVLPLSMCRSSAGSRRSAPRWWASCCWRSTMSGPTSRTRSRPPCTRCRCGR